MLQQLTLDPLHPLRVGMADAFTRYSDNEGTRLQRC